MTQQLVLLPHNQQVLGLKPVLIVKGRPVWSLHVLPVGSLWVLWLPPTVQEHAHQVNW